MVHWAFDEIINIFIVDDIDLVGLELRYQGVLEFRRVCVVQDGFVSLNDGDALVLYAYEFRGPSLKRWDIRTG